MKYVRDKSHSKFDLFNNIYPIGSIYMSINETNPSALFGGTWEQIKDTFLLSAGDTYTAGSTGGESEHKLTIEEMPNHSHKNYAGSNINENGTFAMVGWRGNVSEGTAFEVWGVGNDKPHNNMPPYLTVYMWKRIA